MMPGDKNVWLYSNYKIFGLCHQSMGCRHSTSVLPCPSYVWPNWQKLGVCTKPIPALPDVPMRMHTVYSSSAYYFNLCVCYIGDSITSLECVQLLQLFFPVEAKILSLNHLPFFASFYLVAWYSTAVGFQLFSSGNTDESCIVKYTCKHLE